MNNISRRSFLKGGAVSAAAAALSLPAKAASPEAENKSIPTACSTQSGTVQGKADGAHLVWYGIPYGAAPVGEARWSAPLDPVPWTGSLDCTQPAPVAYQFSTCPIGSEDCLRLDVYSVPSAHSRPVLVYLHGGNNQIGDSLELPGGELVENDDCVFVSINYRLGLFGFNCLPALCSGGEATGNFALLDIAKALDWVRDNISAFGGDPSNVTLSGFSAGGRDVMACLTSPLFADRFQKAISFSGGITFADENASARQIANALAPLAVEDGRFSDEASAFNWLLTPDPAVREWLYSVEPARLCSKMTNAGIRMSRFPHLYQDNVVLPKAGFAAGTLNRVPLLLLTGSTEFSANAFSDGWFTSDAAQSYTTAELSAAKQFASRYGSAFYRRFNAEASAETIAPQSDAPVYLCQVEYGSDNSRTPLPPLGSFHGIFLPMLSSENGFRLYADFTAAGYQAMAKQFNTYLKNFLACGDPNGRQRSSLPDWPAWTPTARHTLVLDADATAAYPEVKDTSTTDSAILAAMDADTTLSPTLKSAVIQNVLNGRWFSAPIDEHYHNVSLWV